MSYTRTRYSSRGATGGPFSPVELYPPGTTFDNHGKALGGARPLRSEGQAAAAAKSPDVGRRAFRGLQFMNMLNMAQTAVFGIILFLGIAAIYDFGGKPIGIMHRAQTWLWFFVGCSGVNVLGVSIAIAWMKNGMNTDLHADHFTPAISQFFYTLSYTLTCVVLFIVFLMRFNDELPTFNDRFDADVMLNATAGMGRALEAWNFMMAIVISGALVYFKFQVDNWQRHNFQVFAHAATWTSVGQPVGKDGRVSAAAVAF